VTTPTTDVRYYSGWQRERTGFLFHLTGPQFTLALATVACVAVPVLTRSVALLAIGLPFAMILAGLTWARVAGRTATEWAGLAARFTTNRAKGQSRFLSGAFAPRDRAQPNASAPLDLPGPLATLRFLEAETGGLLGGGADRRIAVVHHPLDDTYTAIARIRYAGIALADTAARESRIAGWGDFLAQMCTERSPFVRVAVVQRTIPDDGSELRRWHTQALRPDAPELAVSVVEELLAQVRVTGSQQTSWLVLTMDPARARTQVGVAGGGEVGALAFLVRQLAAASSAIGAAHLEVEGWVGVRELAEVIRTAFDPTCSNPVDPRHAGPAAAEVHWAHYRHDSGFSVSYEIAEWPRVGVPAWFLRPLLSAQLSARRSFALVAEPVPPRRAERMVMRARTKRAVAIGLRRRTGQLVPEHEMQALAEAELMDRHHAAGHGLVRFVGYVTVTVTDAEILPLACSELENDAAQSGLTVRRLWGAQDVGFHAAALPLGLGLPKARCWA
jgi:hypothetical protein